jgi:ribonuclease P protein component
MNESFSKSERIHSERSIDTLFSEGRRGFVHPLKYCWITTENPEAVVSILVSVPKKAFKRAWKRNLIKRRIKESYRRQKHLLVEPVGTAGKHIDLAFICAPGEIPDYKTIDNAIARILEQIKTRS